MCTVLRNIQIVVPHHCVSASDVCNTTMDFMYCVSVSTAAGADSDDDNDFHFTLFQLHLVPTTTTTTRTSSFGIKASSAAEAVLDRDAFLDKPFFLVYDTGPTSRC